MIFGAGVCPVCVMYEKQRGEESIFMRELKLLLACGVLFGMTAGIAACDVEDGADCEVGDCVETDGGAGGEGGEGGGVMGPEYRYVFIVDDTMATGGQGTDGADICGVVVDCDGTELTGIAGTLTVGGGQVCDGNTTEAPCESGVDRANPETALDTGAMCDPANNSMPPSHYVSLGLSGQLAIEFEQDLQGCSITVVEHAGRDTEPYDVYVCESTDFTAETCVNMGESLARVDGGGEAIVDVPAAAEE